MRRVWAVVLVGVSSLFLNQPIHAMHKVSTPPGALGTQLGKRQPGPSLTAAQQATIKRRIVTAMSGLDKVHVVGTKAAPIPPEALDALAEWRGANAKDVEMWWDPDTRTPFFIKGNDLALPTTASLGKLGHDPRTATAAGTFSRLPEFLGLRNAATELRQISQQTDHLGLTHVRFQQTYRGHDVWARDLYCHFTADSRMNLINGRWAPTPVQLDGIDPVLSASAGIEAVRAHFADRTQVETTDTTLVVYIDSDQIPHWAWMVRTPLGPTEGYDVFIDAVTGEYLHQVSFVYSDGPVVGSGVDLFGVSRTVNAYLKNSINYMINTTKPMFNVGVSIIPYTVVGGIVIGNKHGGTGTPSFEMSANPNTWDAAAVSCQRNLDFIHEYYWNTHGRNSMDGNGGTVYAVVNDGSQPGNSSFSPGSKWISFGIEVPGEYNEARALDIVGHEWTHGVVDATAGLVYEFQSGALNESLADIFGTMVEFYAEGGLADWLEGEDAKAPGSAFRSLANPPLFDQPDRMSNFVYKSATDDHGGVHTNSGIPNKAFYLAASALGRGKADSIYYHALKYYLGQRSGFIDCRRTVLQAAANLYPGNTSIQDSIAGAFDAVEIYDGPPTLPPGAEPAPTSAQWVAAIDKVTGRVARFDTAGNFQYLISSAIAMKKPSVPDSAQVVLFIDGTSAVRAVGATGLGETQISTPGIVFNNISVSPDGRRFAYDLDLDPTIYIFDLVDTTGASDRTWLLYTPTYTDSSVAHDVFQVDVLEWDINGQKIFYDCYNRLPRQNDTLWYWDILTLNAQTGVIQRAIPAIPTGVTIGNPTVAKTRHEIIAFDAELSPGAFTVVGADLEKNRLGVITPNGASWGFPSFSPDDHKIMYQNTIWDSGLGMFRTHLWRVGLDTSHIVGLGNDQVFALDAALPNWRFTGRDTPVDVTDGEDGPGIPSAFSLYQNYPNPFNASTVISYDARSAGPVALEIFNILGQRVFVRNEESVLPGRHTFTWNGMDQSGAPVPSGLYLYRVTVGGAQQTRKMVLLK